MWNLLYYKNLNKKLENEVGKFLRENTNSPKVYSNDIRHQYAGALYARNKGSNASYALGELNEFFNANQSGYEDTAIDKINNEIGRMYAIKYPNIPKKELLKILLNDWDKNREYAEIIMKTRK